MTLPNDSHVSGSTTFATHLIGGKEYPVGLSADAEGRIRGSLPTFGLFVPPAAVGASKVFFDLHNGMASGVLRLRKLFAVVATDVAITGTLGVRVDVLRTSSVGTGGTAATTTTSASKTAPGFWAFDAVTALPSGITARTIPTGGATDEQYYFPAYIFTEETNAASQMSQWFNLLPELSTEQTMELPVGKGLKIVQGTEAGAGNIGFLIVFSVE